jgi:serine phosphatase RsbU (regulator of sigma subunit)
VSESLPRREALAQACHTFCEEAANLFLVEVEPDSTICHANRCFLRKARLIDLPRGQTIGTLLAPAAAGETPDQPAPPPPPPWEDASESRPSLAEGGASSLPVLVRFRSSHRLFQARWFPWPEGGGLLLGEALGDTDSAMGTAISAVSAEMTRLVRELQRQQALLREDLQAAAVIQQCLLPQALPDLGGFRCAWRFQPCAEVGGDLFQVLPLGPGRAGVCILDVAGHGVRAAMLTVAIAQALGPDSPLVFEGPPGDRRPARPGTVLARLDAEFPFERFETYFTMVYLILDGHRGTVRLASAGHPHPLVMSAGTQVRTLPGTGPIVGFGTIDPEEEHEIELAPGDRLVLFNDGVTERRNGHGKFWGVPGLTAALTATQALPLDEALEAILERVTAYGEGRPFEDDLTLLAFEFCGPRVTEP